MKPVSFAFFIVSALVHTIFSIGLVRAVDDSAFLVNVTGSIDPSGMCTVDSSKGTTFTWPVTAGQVKSQGCFTFVDKNHNVVPFQALQLSNFNDQTAKSFPVQPFLFASGASDCSNLEPIMPVKDTEC